MAHNDDLVRISLPVPSSAALPARPWSLQVWLLDATSSVVLLVATACGSDLNAGEDPSSGTASSPADAADDPVLPGFVPLGPEEVCGKLLECADEQVPSQYGDFFPAFGTGGSCWSQQDPATCRQACLDAMRGLSCDYCDSPAECPCHPQNYTCVQCLADSDCPIEFNSQCDPVSFECVSCVTDEDCALPECPHHTGTCEWDGYGGKTCSHAYTSTSSITIRGSGLHAWEGTRVLVHFANEPAQCGPDTRSWVLVEQGGFEATWDDLLRQTLSLTLAIDVDDDFRDAPPDPIANIVIEDALGENAVIEVSAEDFEP